jgi:hypothetical protein
MKTLTTLCTVMSFALGASSHAADKTLIDYFLPTPIQGTLVSNVWGAPGVFPRDPQNGLEDTTMKQWCYWDGQIIKGPDGKYHMFASRWDQAKGHNGWWGSSAVHAVSDNFTFAVLDVPKDQERGNDTHGSKVIVVPFDGVALDRDMQNLSKEAGAVDRPAPR